MTLLVLHLSDLHIKEATDEVLGRASLIACTLFDELSEASAVVILFSGDIAQAGTKSQYDLAYQFLQEIESEIIVEREIPILYVLAPGNHDCDFTGDLSIRQAILGNIQSHLDNLPIAYINEATSVQKNYKAFAERVTDKNYTSSSSPLSSMHTFSIEGKTIVFDSLNASWMSTVPEQQGKLYFPIEEFYQSTKDIACDLRMLTFHHPLNWFAHTNSQKLRANINRLADIVFTGHEHLGDSRYVEDTKYGECVYVEGACLFERTTHTSGFNVITLNLETATYKYTEYEWQRPRYMPTSKHPESHYRKTPRSAEAVLAITEDFAKRIRDPGAALTHPTGIELCLDDIFVYPDLDARSTEQKTKRGSSATAKISSRNLEFFDQIQSHILIEGDDTSGKTTLLFKLFQEHHEQGFVPLFLRGPQIKSAAPAELAGLIRAAVIDQYGRNNLEVYEQTAASKKIFLVDDFDRSSLNSDARAVVMEKLVAKAAKVIMTVGERFEVSELFAAAEFSSLLKFEQYRILPLGAARRAELFRKWNSIGNPELTSTNALLKAEDDAERIIKSAQLKHVASTIPIFVLTLIQASSTSGTIDAHGSSLATYYQYLISAALTKAGVRPQDLDEYLQVCTHLSWYIKANGQEHAISRLQFRQFLDSYSKTWTTTDESDVSDILKRAKLVEFGDDDIAFTYSYGYYFFLGKYCSISTDADVVSYVDFCVDHLYVRDCANTLLFLAHHSGTRAVLDSVVLSLTNTFSDRKAITLALTDVENIARLIREAPVSQYKLQKPLEYRDKRAAAEDSHDTGHDGLADEPTDTLSARRDFVTQLVSMGKAIEIAGALLSQKHSNYQNATKNEAISAIFDASLRSIDKFFSYFETDSEKMIQDIVGRLRSRDKEISLEQATGDVRAAVGFIIRMVTTSFIRRAGMFINSPKLVSNIDVVVAEKPTNAIRLVRLAQKLATPASIPRAEIAQLLEAEEDNACVFSVLRDLVLHRLYMYDTPHDEKAWALETFKLRSQASWIGFQTLSRIPPKRLS